MRSGRSSRRATDVGEVEEARGPDRRSADDAEPLLEPREHRRRDRARDLEADDGAEPALAQLALDRLEQVVGVVGDLGVAVAGETERDALDHLHLGEEPREEVRDRRLERDLQATLADREEAGEPSGHLDPCEALLARLGVAHDDTEAEREAGDVRERLAGADRERGQHRDRSAARRCARARRALRQSRPRRCRPAFRSAASAGQSCSRQSRACSAVSSSTRARISSSVCCDVRPSRERTATPETTWSEQAGDAHHEELVQVVREDAAELDALEQRLVRVRGQLEDAGVEIEPGKLSIQQRLDGRVGVQARGRHGPLSIADLGERWGFDSVTLLEARSAPAAEDDPRDQRRRARGGRSRTACSCACAGSRGAGRSRSARPRPAAIVPTMNGPVEPGGQRVEHHVLQALVETAPSTIGISSRNEKRARASRLRREKRPA